jgi:peptide/nickel transport system substrate-binding protein
MFDTRVPPFNHVDARRAVNWAVDRRALVDLYGGPAIAVPTCQLLPPGFPGYSWYCPYTRGPHDGRYHGPDVIRARELVRRSGTAGTRVSVWQSPSVVVPPFCRYLVRVLRSIGYDAVLREAPDNDYFYDPRHHVQVQSNGFAADYPVPSTFYDTMASCLNTWAFCDRALDRAAARAAKLQFSDPGAALRAWTRIDRTVTNLAVLVPGVTTYDWRFVSARVGNYTVNDVYGPVLSQLWVR